MKKSFFWVTITAAIIIIVLPGCQAIGQIFKAGIWTGIFIVALIIGVILYLTSRAGKK
ncbi:phosphatidate cytidylyltransferase [Ferruginibacter sp.]|uniref:phosphatidate cytidylyltransferase n=1 Tax=Ferruginibacter sp. TaxID=1940288 RepID=UPI0019B070DE|nr:phosphatidate cytidylyltransferase [Ferruginibacter sp.]MBC7628497.1 phosphatidate cytidylyltransferase [Ferruginibacter sp.]